MTPWEEYPKIWKTKASFMSWLRGGIRRSLWNRSPIKVSFINNNRKRIANPNPRGKVKEVWGGECALCKQDHVIANLQCDHITGNHSLNDLSDIQPFIEGIVLISENDLQFACKECHKIKNHAEKLGISFEEARVEKFIIEIIKQKKDREYLSERGIIPESSQAKRREQLTEVMKNERN